MGKGLFYDGNLYSINEWVEMIVTFCKKNPSEKELFSEFPKRPELGQMVTAGVIFEKNGSFFVAESVKILPSAENVLTAVTFYFGFQCNLNCRHCHSRIMAKDSHEEMDEMQAKHIANEIIKAKPLTVRLGGGEPLMRNDFLPIISQFNAAGITISFTTNGWFLNREIAQAITQFKHLEPVRLSIHGFGEEHDDFTRVPGSFLRLQKAQRNLKDHGLEHKFVVVISRQTEPNILHFIDFSESSGAEGILFRALKPSGNASEDQLLRPDEWRAVYDLIQREAKRRKIRVDFSPSGPPVTRYIGLDQKCLCGRNTLTVRPSGDYSACGIYFDTIGNVLEGNLDKVWLNSPKLKSIREGDCPCERKKL